MNMFKSRYDLWFKGTASLVKLDHKSGPQAVTGPHNTPIMVLPGPLGIQNQVRGVPQGSIL